MSDRMDSKARGGSGSQRSDTGESTESARWLSISGTAALVGAAGMLAMGSFVPAATGWIQAAAKQGITAGSAALAGVVLLGIHAASRRRAPAPVAPAIDETAVAGGLVLEQVAADLADARGALKDLRVDLVYLKDALGNGKGQRASKREAPSADASAHDGVFRVAASVDQLGSRIDARLRKQEDMTIDALAQIQRTMRETRARLDELSQRIEAPPPVEQRAAELAAPQAHAHAHEFDADVEEIATGFEPSDDDVHVTVELDDDGPELGLLDRLDDAGVLRTSPSDTPRIDAEALDLLQIGSTFDRQRADDSEIAAKLEEVRGLLSDPRVRAAFEDRARLDSGAFDLRRNAT